MSAKIRNYMRHNVLGLVAIFIALSGTAYATHPGGANTISSGDIINDNVNTADVRDDTLPNGGLQAVDLRADSVGSSEVADDSLGAIDLAPDSVGSSEVTNDSLSALDLAPDSVTSSETAADSVGTSEVINGSLTRDDINESSLFQMNATPSRPSPCNPTGPYITCGSVSLNLAQVSDVLITATAGLTGNAVGEDQGSCILQRGTTSVPGLSAAIALGQEGNEHTDADLDTGDGFARSGVDSNVSVGSNTWNLRCSESNGDLRISDVHLTALAIAN